MAYNSYGPVYRQQLPPQTQTPTRHYAGQTHAHIAGRPPQREDVQYRSDNRWNGQNGHNAPRGNGVQNGYMLDPYENINQGYVGSGYNGPVSAEPQGPGPGQGRVYQYDERYYNEGNGQSRPNAPRHDGGEVLIGDTRRRAQSKREYRSLPDGVGDC
jgi:hypothetical protein